MPSFGQRSIKNLYMVHPNIIDVLEEAIKYYDFTVLEGLRSSERQKELYDTGKSQTLNSKHLRQPDGYSHAVDIAPYPIDWENIHEFTHLAYLIKGIAADMGINLRWGGDWRSFKDCPHFQLEEKINGDI